jgi:epidermal growth factor receptor substrate 15
VLFAGETAKQIFERARLPNDILGRIWNLADITQRGQLDATEFIIAMHMLTSYKTGVMRGIPSSLPAGLYEAASKRGLTRTPTGPRVGSDVPPVPAIPTQFSGSQRTQSPLNRQQFASPLSAHSTGADWLINPQEKAQFDNIFATVDTAKAGIINGDQAVTFFTNAQLGEDVLAQIWDLADIDADGQLTRDEFAVAMYLVRQQRSRKEPLPNTLPPALIPPSMRRQEAPPAVAPVAPAPPPLPRSAAEDLFGLDTFDAPAAPAAPAIPQTTGGSNAPFQSPSSPSSRTSHQASSVTTFKPFVPSSLFGQSLNPQVTGAGATAKSPSPGSDDLLGDNDPEESNKLTQETTELANLSNQIGSLSKEMQNVQTRRASTEQEFTQSSQQKRDFETRLAQARAMYEKEAKDFKALEDRLNASRAETKKLQQDYALIEGSRQDLQNQYSQVSAALAADQNENVSLKEKIRQANAAVSQLKPALEKARSDARQQKGLVAINKKQLATVEGERDKAQDEIDSLAKENQELEESARSASGTAAVASPSLSTASHQTNPFFRRTTAEISSEAVASPGSNPQAAFDNLFGPASATASTSTPPPQTSFGAAPPFSQNARDASKSPFTSGAPTPSVSPPPPPASDSRQITPSYFQTSNENHAQSLTSSTVVSPPVSRFGGFDTSEAGTLAPQESASVAREPSNLGNETSSAASPFDDVPKKPALEEATFPGAPTQISTQLTGGPSPEKSNDTAEASPSQAKEESFDELFGSVARERSKSQKANDFDEAFAGMKPRDGEAPNAFGEFPPIKEFEADDDDDDDSTDSEAPMGFDDNFTPVSPPPKEDHAKNESIDATQLQAFPVPGANTASTEPPPAPDAQQSPPSYDGSSANKEPGHFPRTFDGLLPNRADPTLAPDAPHTVESSSGAPIVAGESQKKSGAPDFDAAFAGLDLAPAKEEDDDDSDDEEDVGPDSKKPANDFDFSFDSPSQSAKPVSTPSAQPGQANTAAADFFNFDNNVDASKNSEFGSEKPPTTDHDWDAIFTPSQKASEGGSNGFHASDSQAAGGEDKRSPGWALASETGEDDLILKRLTGMGFPRDESLAALEKFDYNIDKVITILLRYESNFC